MDLNSRVDAMVVANVDERTDVRTDEKRIPISRHALGRHDNKIIIPSKPRHNKNTIKF